MSTPSQTPTASARPEAAQEPLFRIRRNDGRWALHYTFDSRAEAERYASELTDENRPFRYAVVAVQPEASR